MTQPAEKDQVDLRWGHWKEQLAVELGLEDSQPAQ